MKARTYHSEADDARLRQALADMNIDTSALHDDAVLAKARAVANEIATGADGRDTKSHRSLE